MVKIITSAPTTLALLEAPVYQDEQRTYLGMSQLGHSCSTFLWLSFRWAFTSTHSARIHRLFKRGHREEPEIIAELNNIGITVHSTQAEFIAGWGHIKGHCDGIAEGVIEAPKTPHLAEFKTMSDKYFNEMCKLGCEKAKPIYFGQCQVGMKYFGLKRALFLAVNKNDDAYYVERIKYNPEIANMLVARAEGIIVSHDPPKRMFKPSWYECKFCSAKNQCHNGFSYHMSCRTCVNVSIEKDGQWACRIHGVVLTIAEQRSGCDRYESLPKVS